VHYVILTAIGNTPLIRLERVIPGAGFRLFAKLEGLEQLGEASILRSERSPLLRHSDDLDEHLASARQALFGAS